MNVWAGLIQNRLQAVKAPALQLHCFCMGDRQTQKGQPKCKGGTFAKQPCKRRAIDLRHFTGTSDEFTLSQCMPTGKLAMGAI